MSSTNASQLSFFPLVRKTAVPLPCDEKCRTCALLAATSAMARSTSDLVKAMRYSVVTSRIFRISFAAWPSERRRQQRAGAPQVAPVEPERGHQQDARGRLEQPRGQVALAQQQEHGGGGVEEPGAVHHRVVPEHAPPRQLVRVERVHALVVAHRALAQEGEVRDQVHGDERRPQHALGPARLSQRAPTGRPSSPALRTTCRRGPRGPHAPRPRAR